MSKWISWWRYDGEKTVVTYKCQKRFLRRLSTYKCCSESAGDHMLVKKRQLPINVKNGFWDGSVPINVKVKWLVTTNEKKNHLWIPESEIDKKAVRSWCSVMGVQYECSYWWQNRAVVAWVIATAGGCCVCKLLCGGGAVGVVVCVSCCVGVVQWWRLLCV